MAQESPPSARPGLLARLRARAGVFFEFGLIIVGALLALALDDWRENAERAERDRVVLELVSTEMAANRSLLETGSTYHEDMMGPITESAARMVSDNVFSVPEGWTGVQPILLTRSAFDLAVNSGVLARMPADASLALSQVYEAMDDAERRRNNIQLVTLQTDFTDGVRYLRLQQEGVRSELEATRDLVPLLIAAERVVRPDGGQ